MMQKDEIRSDNVAIGVGLADAIGGVRAELERAARDGQDSEIGFDPGPVELEFQLGFQNTIGGTGGVRVWVVSMDAKGETVRSGTHRLKVTLTPQRRKGENEDKLIRDVGTR